MRTIIRNGRIVTAVDDYRADILIEDETIAAVGVGVGDELFQLLIGAEDVAGHVFEALDRAHDVSAVEPADL